MAQSTLTKFKSLAAAPARVKGKRPDIQGLRTVAVLAVIFDHLMGWPSGGFVGVDIFFVISGFLITGLLLREWERTGKIGFVSFYKRRIKRILPASMLVLVVTVAATFMLFTSSRAFSVLWDGVWGSLFVANWRFAAVGTDYFQLDGPVSPLQHFWSLAIEEQFYFVWPWIMLLALVLATKSRASRLRPRVAAACVIGVISVASLVWAMNETTSSPTLAYFSTLSRAWELGVGALLALASPLLLRIPKNVAPLISWIGLSGIVVSLFVVDAASGFPAPGALLPVLSTALIIAAGAGGNMRYMVPLTNRVSQYLGDISFSLYLWHFPVIILGAAFVRTESVVTNGLMLLCILAASVFAYHLVEDPVRKSQWLEGAKKKRRLEISEKYKLTSLAFFAVLTLSLAAVALVQTSPTTPPMASAPLVPSSVNPSSVAAKDAMPALAALQVKIRGSLASPTWPDLTPGLDSLGTENWLTSLRDSGCSSVDQARPASCLSGEASASKTAVIIGDSIAMAWAPGIRKSLLDQGFRVQSLNKTQCPAATISVTQNGGEPFPECDQHHEWSQEYAASLNPDLIILASARNTLTRLASGSKGAAAMTEYQSGLSATIESLSQTGASVIVLSAPPEGKALQECATNISKPQDCITAGDDTLTGMVKAELAATGKTGAKSIDTRTWFCSTEIQCPAFVGVTPVRADTAHITAEYSEQLSPVIAEALNLISK